MNCSKWALTLAELDASDLIRLVSHSVRASSWRTGPSDTLSEREKTQRAAACSGLRIMSPQDMWRVLHTYTPSVFVCVCASIACVERPRVTAHDHVCTHVCKSAYCVCTSERECIWYVTCVYSAACVYYIVQHMCTCISVKFHICVCEHGHTCVCLWWTSKWYI